MKKTLGETQTTMGLDFPNAWERKRKRVTKRDKERETKKQWRERKLHKGQVLKGKLPDTMPAPDTENP